MKIFTQILAVLAAMTVAAAVVGCKSKNYVTQLRDLDKTACACKDRACGESALKELKAVFEDMNKNKATGSNEELQQISQYSGNIAKCIILSGVAPQEVLKVAK